MADEYVDLTDVRLSKIYVKYFYHRDTKELMPKSLFLKLVDEYGSTANGVDVSKAARRLGY